MADTQTHEAAVLGSLAVIRLPWSYEAFVINL